MYMYICICRVFYGIVFTFGHIQLPSLAAGCASLAKSSQNQTT